MERLRQLQGQLLHKMDFFLTRTTWVFAEILVGPNAEAPFIVLVVKPSYDRFQQDPAIPSY